MIFPQPSIVKVIYAVRVTHYIIPVNFLNRYICVQAETEHFFAKTPFFFFMNNGRLSNHFLRKEKRMTHLVKTLIFLQKVQIKNYRYLFLNAK